MQRPSPSRRSPHKHSHRYAYTEKPLCEANHLRGRVYLLPGNEGGPLMYIRFVYMCVHGAGCGVETYMKRSKGKIITAAHERPGSYSRFGWFDFPPHKSQLSSSSKHAGFLKCDDNLNRRQIFLIRDDRQHELYTPDDVWDVGCGNVFSFAKQLQNLIVTKQIESRQQPRHLSGHMHATPFTCH